MEVNKQTKLTLSLETIISDAVLDTQEDVEEIKKDIKSIETYILNKK